MSFLEDEIFERHATTWRDLGEIFLGKWRIIALTFGATVLGAYFGLQLVTERYESKANLLVKLGRENAEVPTTVQNSGFVATGLRKEGINSEVQILTSRSLLEQTVDKLGPEAFAFRPAPPQTILQAVRTYVKMPVRWAKESGRELLIALNLKKKVSQRESAIQMLEDSLRVEPEKDSDVIAIDLRLPDPQLCQSTLNDLLQLYLDQHMRAWRSPAAKEFFGTQLKEYNRRLQELQGVRDQVRTQWNLSSIDEQRTLLLNRLSDTTGQIERNNAEAADLGRQKALMMVRLRDLPERVSSTQVEAQNPSIQSIKDRITTLELERAKLSSRYLADAEPVKKVESEIGDLQALLRVEKPTILGSVSSEMNPIRQNFTQAIEQYNVKIAGLQEKNTKLQGASVEIGHQLHVLNGGEDRLETVERDYKIAQDNYLGYAKRMEEGRISDELDLSRVSNVSILSPPAVSLEPVYPRKLLVMGMALALGLALGLAVVLLLHYMDDTIKRPRDIADLEGLRVLGTIRLRPFKSQETFTR